MFSLAFRLLFSGKFAWKVKHLRGEHIVVVVVVAFVIRLLMSWDVHKTKGKRYIRRRGEKTIYSHTHTHTVWTKFKVARLSTTNDSIGTRSRFTSGQDGVDGGVLPNACHATPRQCWACVCVCESSRNLIAATIYVKLKSKNQNRKERERERKGEGVKSEEYDH